MRKNINNKFKRKRKHIVRHPISKLNGIFSIVSQMCKKHAVIGYKGAPNVITEEEEEARTNKTGILISCN